MATKIIDIDLEKGPPSTYNQLQNYQKAMIIFRWKGKPIGDAWIKLNSGTIDSHEILATAIEEIRHKVLGVNTHEQIFLNDLSLKVEPTSLTCSVIVCTRDRSDVLIDCILSLCQAKSDSDEIIIVDNAPSSDDTQNAVKKYPVIYVREMRQGLNWARARGAREAKGDILIYTDDDVIVEKDWINEMKKLFINRKIAAVTGIILPFELETEAQEIMEQYFSYRCGYDLIDFHISNSPFLFGGKGSGASMAIRRKLVINLKLFDSEMDCGTVTHSGGDTYAFYRLLSLGYHIVYNPAAVCKHKHRRDEKALRKTLFGYGVGMFVCMVRALVEEKDFRVFYNIYWIYRHWLGKLLLKGIFQSPYAPPFNITLEIIKGSIIAPEAYLASKYHENYKLGL